MYFKLEKRILFFFIVLKTEMTVSKTLLFVVYGVMKGIQTFMYAWYGSIIISEVNMYILIVQKTFLSFI